jgi:hypothetical protein
MGGDRQVGGMHSTRLVRLRGAAERAWVAVVVAVLGGVGAGMLLAVRAARAWVGAHPAETQRWLEQTYMAFDRTSRLPVPADGAYRGITQALSASNPATVVWVLSVAGGYAVLVAWFLSSRRRARAGRRGWLAAVQRGGLRALTVGMVALPLLGAAEWAHPAAAFRTIEPEAGSARYLQAQLAPPGTVADQRPLYRVYTSQPLYLGQTDVEPNVLLPTGIQEAGGYSSLSTTINLAYGWAAETSQGRMLDVWNARYFLWPNTPASLPSWELTSFHPLRPLASGNGANAGATAAFRVPSVVGENMRVIATLRDAARVPAGTTVAWITATDDGGEEHRWPLRYGIEIAEATVPPPGALGMTPDQAVAAGIRPLPVFSYKEYDGAGQPYGVYFYYAKLPLDGPRTIVRLAVQPVFLPDAATAILRVYGLGVGQPDWWVHNVMWSDRERFMLAYTGPAVQVYRNDDALPRAYLVPLAVRAPAAVHIKQMAERGFDPERMLLLDAGTNAAGAAIEGPSEPLGAGSWFTPPEAGSAAAHVVRAEDALGRVATSPAGRATVERYGGDRVDVRVQAAQDAWLFLADTYDPSWRAYVDGQARPVRLANAMFRAVAVPAGTHTVTFRYEPWPLAWGAAISLLTGLGVLAACAVAIGCRQLTARRESGFIEA